MAFDAHLVHDYGYAASALPARVTLRLRIRALGLDLLDDLIGSGDLDPAIRSRVPTFDVGAARLEWLRSDGVDCVPEWHEHRE